MGREEYQSVSAVVSTALAHQLLTLGTEIERCPGSISRTRHCTRSSVACSGQRTVTPTTCSAKQQNPEFGVTTCLSEHYIFNKESPSFKYNGTTAATISSAVTPFIGGARRSGGTLTALSASTSTKWKNITAANSSSEGSLACATSNTRAENCVLAKDCSRQRYYPTPFTGSAPVSADTENIGTRAKYRSSEFGAPTSAEYVDSIATSTVLPISAWRNITTSSGPGVIYPGGLETNNSRWCPTVSTHLDPGVCSKIALLLSTALT